MRSHMMTHGKIALKRRCGRKHTYLTSSAIDPIGLGRAAALGLLPELLLNMRVAPPLERDGLVLVAVDPRDRRSRTVILAEAGRACPGSASALWKTAQKTLEGTDGSQNAADLRRTLNTILNTDFVESLHRVP